jgi:hypothetical protein
MGNHPDIPGSEYEADHSGSGGLRKDRLVCENKASGSVGYERSYVTRERRESWSLISVCGFGKHIIKPTPFESLLGVAARGPNHD